jgi:hypothetical protein
MNDVEQRLTDLLRARAERVRVTVELDDVKVAGPVDLVALERREQPRDRQISEDEVAEFGASEGRADEPMRGWPRRGLMRVAAAGIVVFAIGLLAVAARQNRDSVPTDTVAPAVPFVLVSPSTVEQSQATDVDLYRHGDVGIQISASGNFVSLRRCRESASATCGSGWAYVTRTAGDDQVQGGLLGEASPLNLHLQVLDDRHFVAWEAAANAQAPAKAWLIDAVTGQAGRLRWRDEPATLQSPDQKLLLCDESYSSLATHCAVVRGSDAADGGWRFSPTDGGLPKVVNLRDGTIRPLAMPDSVVAGLPVAQHGSNRIWIGTNAEGDRLGLAFSDDGGATWTDVQLPQPLRATSEELGTSLVPNGDDLLEIAADGDRIAVARSWGGDDNLVYVSDDAGTNWTTANSEPDGNGVHLYVLLDGRLVVMGSVDPYPADLLVSTASDWAELEKVDIGFGDDVLDDSKRLSVNSAGVATIASFATPCNGTSPCPGYTPNEAERSVLDTIDFSTDLANWSTIQIPRP